MTTSQDKPAIDTKPPVAPKPAAPAPKLELKAGDAVRYWRNKRPLTLRDYQEGTVVAVGPTKAKAGDDEKGVAVELKEGEHWLRVVNAANGKAFLVVSKHSPTPEPGAFSLLASA